MKQMKPIVLCTAVIALISIAAIGVAVLALRGRSTAAVPSDGISAVKKVVKKKPIEKSSVPARAKKTEASSVKAAKPEPVRPEGGGTVAGGNDGETPKAENMEAGKKAKDDNPFPRYLDMFRNDPAALAAEFEKEAEADRANHRKMRDKAIAKLKLNGEQAAVFEKALDDLKNAIFQHEQEEVDLITSGQANMDTAADGKFWSSNLLLMDQFVAAKEKIVRDAAVELYNQLDVDSVPDAEKQKIIKWATYNTSFSFDCYEPVLQVYDKVYKNMGFGKGIFSWCVRPPQKK